MLTLSAFLKRRALGVAAWFLFFCNVVNAAVPPVTVAPSPESIGRYDIYEITLTDPTKYANPWMNVTISATFTAPSKKTWTVGGFSYDGAHTWKVRFAPNEASDATPWTWSLTYDNGTGQFSANGSFKVTPLNGNGAVNSGFVRIHPTNKLRLITEGDGRCFSPRSLNNDHFGADTLAWGMPTDANQPAGTTTSQFFKTMSVAGLNTIIIRGSDFGGLDPNNKTFDSVKLRAYDEAYSDMHNAGMKIIPTIFQNAQRFVKNGWDTSGPNWTATQNYMRYFINRYGAYADIWEFMVDGNGPIAPTEAGNAALEFIHQNDPYRHPVAFRPGKGIPWDIAVAWGYLPRLLNQVDGCTAWLFMPMEQANNMPVIWTEGGCCADGNPWSWSPTRFRIMAWASFFAQGGVCWWVQQSDVQFANCNAYVGPEERAANIIHANFLADFDPAATPIDPLGNANDHWGKPLRCWALASPTDLGAYIVNGGDQNVLLSGQKLPLTVPAEKMRGMWLDPASGKVIELVSVNGGQQTLTIPPFAADIALRLRADALQPRSWVQFDTSSYSAPDSQKSVTLTVDRFGDSGRPASVAFAAQDSQAQAGVDYALKPGVLTWAANDAAPKTITIDLHHIATPKPDRDFRVTLSDPQGLALGTASKAVVVIKNTVYDYAQFSQPVYAADKNAGNMTITVKRMGNNTANTLQAYYSTMRGSGVEGTDFTGIPTKKEILTWPPGDTTPKTFQVPLLNNPNASGSKIFGMALNDRGGPPAGVLTANPAQSRWLRAQAVITDPAAATGIVGFSGYSALKEQGYWRAAAVYSPVAQAKGSVTLTVSRTNGSSGPASIQYATASTGNGDDSGAYAGYEYTARKGELNWADGDSADKTITIPINPTVPTAGVAGVWVTLQKPTGAVAGLSVAEVLIANNQPTLIMPPAMK